MISVDLALPEKRLPLSPRVPRLASLALVHLGRTKQNPIPVRHAPCTGAEGGRKRLIQGPIAAIAIAAGITDAVLEFVGARSCAVSIPEL